MRKKVIALLTLIMVLSFSTYAFAENPTSKSTNVIYEGQGVEEYTVTVPATLNPGQSGDVVLNGTYASNRKVNITCDETVTLTNSINSLDTKVLDITFAGIELVGNNNIAVTKTESVSVEDISDAMFGNWSGQFNYAISISDVSI